MLQENTTSYLYGPGGMVLEQIQDNDKTGTAYYYHADQLGSVRALTDQAGTVVNTYAYDAYGTTTASSETIANPFRYAGEYQDAETGLYYLRARYYDPATQQFLTRDPLVAATEQAYNYAGGSPLNATDPSGLMFASEGQSGGGWGLSPADMVGFGMFFSAGGGGGAGSGNGYLGRRAGWSPAAREADELEELAAKSCILPQNNTLQNKDQPFIDELAIQLRRIFGSENVRTNFPVINSKGKPVEIDIETPNAIIEVKSGGATGLGSQVEVRVKDPMLNPTGKPVIGYGPERMKGAVYDYINTHGGIAARNIDEILDIIVP